MSMSTTTTFRTVKKRSINKNLRANILVVESMLLSLVYIHYNHHDDNDDNDDDYVQQTYLLDIFCIIYFIRLNYMARCLLPRELAIEEITVVPLLWLASIMTSFVALKQHHYHQPSTALVFRPFIIVSTILYVLGSYLNTYSEFERKCWKQLPQNKGKCYMNGLFGYSRNINYYGDTILFAGWASLTGNKWNMWVPIVMGLSFWFYHIPDKEHYLETKYKEEWPTYKKKTPYAFIPFVC